MITGDKVLFEKFGMISNVSTPYSNNYTPIIPAVSNHPQTYSATEQAATTIQFTLA